MTVLYEFLRKWIIKKAFYFNISDTPGLNASTAYLPAALISILFKIIITLNKLSYLIIY